MRPRLALLLLLALVGSACSVIESGLDRIGIGDGEGGGIFAGGDSALARLGIIDPAVEHRSADADAFAEGRDGQELAVGDSLRTDANGFAEIRYRDGSLTRLDYDTEFTLDELATGPLQVHGTMDVGRTWHRVKDIAGTGGSFEIESEVGVAAVRGTSFVVGCRNQICEFGVIEGSVEVTLKTGEVFTLGPGDVLVVGTDGTIVGQRRLAPGDRLVEWIRKNVELDFAISTDDFPVPDLAPQLGIMIVAADDPDDGGGDGGDGPTAPTDTPPQPSEPGQQDDDPPPPAPQDTPPADEPAPTPTEPTSPAPEPTQPPVEAADPVRIVEYGVAAPGGALAVVKANGTARPGDALSAVIASSAGSATLSLTADGSGRWTFEEAGSAPDGDITITVSRAGDAPSEDRATVVKQAPPASTVLVVGHSYRRDNRTWIGLVIVPPGTQPGDVSATVGSCGGSPSINQGPAYWTVTVPAGGCAAGRHTVTVGTAVGSHAVTLVVSTSPN